MCYICVYTLKRFFLQKLSPWAYASVQGPGQMSALALRKAPLLSFSDLPEIKTALLEIETSLPEIETSLPEIEKALPEIEILSYELEMDGHKQTDKQTNERTNEQTDGQTDGQTE